MKSYDFHWIEHWSEKHEPTDPRVITVHTEESDGWYEHDNHYYFMAISDGEAKWMSELFMKESPENFEVFSLVNRETKEVIMTEEEL